MPNIRHNNLRNFSIPDDYPLCTAQTLQQHYQYQSNLLFDRYHPLGGIQIDSAQEWWCLFEDASHYLAHCDQANRPPIFDQFLNLILSTDAQYFGLNLQREANIQLLHDIFQWITNTEPEEQ